MPFTENPIAQFLGSVYLDSFGFDVWVYQNDDGSLRVTSEGLLHDEYVNFEAFLDDLVKKNPLWFTYYFVRCIPAYRDLIKAKLAHHYSEVFDWLNKSIDCTKRNWAFEDDGLGDFAKIRIGELCSSPLNPCQRVRNEQVKAQDDPQTWEVDQFWNGYCPESWLRGKKVRMRLNRQDFFESEDTGLQIAVLRGVQAIILNFRGSGDFRATPEYGDKIVNGEVLSPQNCAKPPFNHNSEIFESSEEIEAFIRKIQ